MSTPAFMGAECKYVLRVTDFPIPANCELCGIGQCVRENDATTQTRRSAQDVLAMFLGVMKDCGYSAEEVKAALRFFAEPKP